MLYILITVFILGLPFLYLFKKKRLKSPGGVILSLYISSFLSAGLIEHFSAWFTIEASAYLGFTLVLFFWPVIIHASRFNKIIIIGNYQLLLPFSRILVMLGFISIVNLFFKIENIFNNILSPTAYRSQKIAGNISFDYGLLEYISLIGLNLYYIQFAMFLIISIIYPDRKKLQNLLLLSSLAYPLTGLAIDMSRGALLMWMLMACLIYISLYSYIESNLRNRINKIILIFMTFILGLFLLVTFGRGEASGDLSMYFIDYFSHQFGNFNRFYAVAANQPNDIRLIFQILGFERQSIPDRAEDLMAVYGFSINVFATFVGDFIISFDAWIIVLMGVTFALIFGFLAQSSSKGLGTFILVLSISEVYVWGLFYYNHGWRISNLLFLLIIALRYVFNPNNSKRLILRVQP
jgi:hypothetical protein